MAIKRKGLQFSNFMLSKSPVPFEELPPHPKKSGTSTIRPRLPVLPTATPEPTVEKTTRPRVERDDIPGTPKVESSPLYHGTATWLSPGTVLEPRHDAFYGDHPVEGIRQSGAYATTDLGIAAKYSKRALEDTASKSMKEHGSFQQPLFTPIYQVSHLSEHNDPSAYFAKDHPWQPAVGQSTYRRDLKGFKVEGNPVGYHYTYRRPLDHPDLDM